MSAENKFHLAWFLNFVTDDWNGCTTNLPTPCPATG